MKITLVHPVGTLSGAVDHQTGALPAETVKTPGLVYFVWKGIQLARGLVLPANPNSTAQQTVRNIKVALSRAWSVSLDATQRNAWKAWAALHNFVDGFQAFNSLAWINYAKNGTLVEDAPVTSAPAMAATLDSVTYDISSFSLTPVFSGVSMTPAQDVLTLVEWTITKLPGAQAVRNTDYRTAHATVPGSIILDEDPTVGGFNATIASGVRAGDTVGLTDRRYARYTVFDAASGAKLLTLSGLVTIAE